MNNSVLLHGKLNGCFSVLSIIRGLFQGSLISVMQYLAAVSADGRREDDKYGPQKGKQCPHFYRHMASRGRLGGGSGRRSVSGGTLGNLFQGWLLHCPERNAGL